MIWFILLTAAVTDVAMAIALKYTDGWTRPWPSVLGAKPCYIGVSRRASAR